MSSLSVLRSLSCQSLIVLVCRLIALTALVPVLLLTAVDVLGWVTFKLILRPLGLTNT